MWRTVARLLDLAIAVALSLALAGATQLRAAEWPNVRASDTLWPTTTLDDAQWPTIPDDMLAKLPKAAPDVAAPATQAAPAAAGDAAATPDTNPKHDFVSSLRTFVLPKAASADKISDDGLLTGSSLPSIKALPAATFAERFASPFSFEGGARYWYSTGQNRFAFANRQPGFGNPTSTLDWDRMQGHAGEGFFRIDHQPTHLFVKGLVGGGIIKGGDMDDLDFFASQTNFSNTTSAVDGNNLRYGIIDLGYSFEVPSEGIRFGGFVGYHWWHEKMTAFGVLCNADSVNNQLCGPAGSTQVSFGTPVDIFDTTWNAIRVGGDAKIQLYDRWSVSGEIAIVPYAWLTNDDSHLLRADLGPVPNIVTHGWSGMGGEAEAFVNYLVTPHFEVGLGARYWGIFTQSGSVDFGPSFAPDFPLTKFSTQRYGVLVQAKASF